MSEGTRSRGWVFTVNNWTEEDRRNLEEKVTEVCKFLQFEEEIGKKGTPHLQGWVYFANARTMRSVSKLIPRAHLERMKGTPEENERYVTKEGTAVFTFGEMPKPGKRTDLDRVKKLVREGVRMTEILEECTSYQMMRSAELLQKYREAPVREKPTVYWLYGPTGTGKTRSAVREAGTDYWISSGSLKWWDGYTGQKTIILDDLRAEDCSLPRMLRLLDRYPVRVETKGSSAWLEATKIFITSPYRPETLYGDTAKGERINQLLRRIDYVRVYEAEEEVIWPEEDVLSGPPEPVPKPKAATKVLLAHRRKLTQRSGVIVGPDPCVRRVCTEKIDLAKIKIFKHVA